MGMIKMLLIIFAMYALYKYVSETYADYVPKKDFSLSQFSDIGEDTPEDTPTDDNDEGKPKKKKGKPGEICFNSLCISKEQLQKEYNVLTKDEKQELIDMLSKEE